MDSERKMKNERVKRSDLETKEEGMGGRIERRSGNKTKKYGGRRREVDNDRKMEDGKILEERKNSL